MVWKPYLDPRHSPQGERRQRDAHYAAERTRQKISNGGMAARSEQLEEFKNTRIRDDDETKPHHVHALAQGDDRQDPQDELGQRMLLLAGPAINMGAILVR